MAPWIDFVRFFQKPPFRLGPPRKGLFQIDASVHSGARWFGKMEREQKDVLCVCVYTRFSQCID